MNNHIAGQPAYGLFKKAVAEAIAPLALVVGSGLSRPAGLPDWQMLRENIQRELDSQEQAIAALGQTDDDNSYYDARVATNDWIFFELARRLLTPAVFNGLIERELTPKDAALPASYSDLMRLRPRGVVTLNLDRFAGDAVARVVDKNAVIPIYGFEIERKWRVLKEERPFVVYLHGHISDPGTWVLTQGALTKLSSKESHQLFISTLYLDYIVAFVGVSLTDISLSQTLISLRSAGFTPSRLFWITTKTDALTDRWAAENNVSLIKYRATTEEEHRQTIKWIVDDVNSYRSFDNPTPPPESGSRFVLDDEAPLDPQQLANFEPEYVRKFLSNKLSERLSLVSTDDTYTEFERFSDEYEYPIAAKSFFRSAKRGFDVFFDLKLTFPKIGGGNFGEVYSAEEQGGKLVAVKIMRQNILGNREMLGGFRRGVMSMKILTKAKVPGVARIIKSFEMPPTIVMELVPGNSAEELFETLVNSPWEKKIGIVYEVSKIVNACHRLKEGVLHRDIKPSNIMIAGFDFGDASFDEIVVLDFDMSWHKGSREEDVVFESRDDFGYLAPEQTNPALLYTSRSTKVDSYGIGMTIYSLFTGQRPIANASLDVAWERRVLANVRRHVNSDFLCVSNRLTRLIIGATALDQNVRTEFDVILSRIEKLKALSEAKDIGVLTPDVVAEEMLARIADGRGDYKWDDLRDEGAFPLLNGLSVVVIALRQGRDVRLKVEFEDTGAIEHRRRDRAVGMAKDLGERFGKRAFVKLNLITYNTGRFLLHADLNINSDDILDESVGECRRLVDFFGSA